MARKKSYAKRRKAKNTKFFAMIIIVTLFFVGFIYYTNSKMDAEIKSLDEQMTSNKKKMKELDEEITSLEEDYDIRNDKQVIDAKNAKFLGTVKTGQYFKDVIENLVLGNAVAIPKLGFFEKLKMSFRK